MAKHWQTRAQFTQYMIYQHGGLDHVMRLINNGWQVYKCQGSCLHPHCRGWYFLPPTKR